jgi:replication-associated recombination protein RarA
MSTASNLLAFRTQSAPVSLTEKYRPATLSEFCGIAKPKEILQRLAERPYSSSWIFRGKSGTGKTTAAMALADAIPAQLQHVASQRCNVAEIERVRAFWSANHHYSTGPDQTRCCF